MNSYQDRNVSRENYILQDGVNTRIINHNQRLQWDSFNMEYFDQELYFRDIQPFEFNLYFLPNMLKAKKLLGCTAEFFYFTKDIWIDIMLNGTGNLQDVHHADMITDILKSRDLNLKQRFQLLYSHYLFSK